MVFFFFNVLKDILYKALDNQTNKILKSEIEFRKKLRSIQFWLFPFNGHKPKRRFKIPEIIKAKLAFKEAYFK